MTTVLPLIVVMVVGVAAFVKWPRVAWLYLVWSLGAFAYGVITHDLLITACNAAGTAAWAYEARRTLRTVTP